MLQLDQNLWYAVECHQSKKLMWFRCLRSVGNG